MSNFDRLEHSQVHKVENFTYISWWNDIILVDGMILVC